MKTIGIILTTIIITIILRKLYFKIKVKKFTNKHDIGQHHCNYCEESFLLDNYELEYEYCPFCGRKLTYHKDSDLFTDNIFQL